MVTGSVPYYGAGTLAVIGASVGRMTCGTLCPFGFLQDILYKVKAYKASMPVWSRWFRYVVLVLLVFLIPFLTHENWFSKLCPCGTVIGGLPWVTLNDNVRSMVRALFWVKVSILIGFVTTSTMVKRPFCRAFCPLGAIFSLFNKSSFLQLAWNKETCTRCGKCQKIWANPDCLRCLDCTRCPSLRLVTVFHKNPFDHSVFPGDEGEALQEVPASHAR
jgi:polyferredoxin